VVPSSSRTGETGRLIPPDEGAHDGSQPSVESPDGNMAVDQLLLQSIEGASPPVLRFYRWNEPTLSLGYFQSLADRQLHSDSGPCAIVRRATGGGAILHHHEITYSVAVAAKNLAGPALDLYRQIHQVWIETLADFGVSARVYRELPESCPAESAATPESFLCFQRRTDEDLIISGYKILGSAQRKTRHGILQHGSLLLKSSRFAPQLPGIRELTGADIHAAALSKRFARRLAAAWSLRWQTEPLSVAERDDALAIAEQKFRADRWLRRR